MKYSTTNIRRENKMPRTWLLCVLSLLAAPAAQAADQVDFDKQVKPILQDRCYSCHGEKKGLGKLRLHTAELIAALEEDGLVVPEDSESSELFVRLTLPADDKLRMPKGGDPLAKEQIEIIKQWIDQGAKLVIADAEPAAGHGENGAESRAARQPDPPPAAPAEALKQLTATGASVVPLYAGSTLLSVGFPSQPDKVDDSILEPLLGVADNVTWLDLGGTKLTDAGAKRLAGLKNLTRLHLEETAITDASVEPLSNLEYLEYLNLYGTKVTDASLTALASSPELRRLYVWQTEVSYKAAKKLESDKAGLVVNLGWDHPGVVRERITKELERVTNSKSNAQQQVKESEAKLAEAKKQLESSTAREAELKNELEALNKPAPDEEQPAAENPAEAKPEQKADEQS